MKLASFHRPGGIAGFGIVTAEGGVIELGPRTGAASLRGVLDRLDTLHQFETATPDARLESLELLPAIPDPDKIICIGINYMTHLKETGRERPERPIIFTRFANTQVGHGQPMIRPKVSERFDYEGELAVVVAKKCRHVPRAQAAAVIAGYSCYNDGSVRDWQRHSIQFTPGKNFPGTGGFGPWLVTPDELPDIARSSLVTRLNGLEVQRATIDDLIFDIPALIEYCSTFTELVPGDVIVTGTTGGVGAYRTPPLWMKPGDTVEVEIDGIGTLRNLIALES
jgi:2-keto-4-pentenoate hydratase/2-oxohepta-3-ene-1,7-dioic acid hydratase in catechol pathway